ncbi:MAG: rRNA maturation RNase YbeY [Francisellaceae bacterium]|jgi:probable rRNA maturation factor|nr:rRNA maturation RNase YbeY [Francisellaceae bacterium]MBT6208045.1 rRNA maturation RNase YbeY [Francisellaceae bacterium]MBT6539737.1 rRNA maturation RNase YbeY [Francisellaceae bacterium]
MTIELELQLASNAKTLPHPAQFRDWLGAVFSDYSEDAELTIRIVDEEEIQELNFKYRDKDKATNVLSFPTDSHHEFDLQLLGDIIICAPIVEKEAVEQDKELLAHWAHLVVHGVLHLLDYDHDSDTRAAIMESLETKILVELGFAPPYGEIYQYESSNG